MQKSWAAWILRSAHTLITLLLLGFASVAPSHATSAARATAPASEVSHGRPDAAKEGSRIALLPLSNHTETSDADSVVLVALRRALARHELSEIPPDEIRPVLRARRIRSQGSLGRDAALALQRELDIDYFLLGSIDFWEIDENPEVGISLRILGGEEGSGDLEILGAVSIGGTGDDFAGLFGVGRIDSIGPLADEIVQRAMHALMEDVRPKQPMGSRTSQSPARSPRPSAVIVPFDNSSENPRAGDIATSLMISALLSAGYRPIEPGFAQEIFFAARTAPRGGIDRPTAEAVWNAFEPDLYVTGEIQVFRLGRGLGGETPPSLELGVRVSDGSTGDFLFSYDRERTDAGTGESLARGRRGSLTSLTVETLDDILRLISNDLEDRTERTRRE